VIDVRQVVIPAAFRSWRKCAAVCLAALALGNGCGERAPREEEPPVPWRKVLSFNVTEAAERKADLGNHRIVIAARNPELGWDINVYDYPVTTNSANLLAPETWHGSQDWMVYAWMKHEGEYPDERRIAYDAGKAELKIVLVDCKTRQTGENAYDFIAGRIEIYHNP
jgi:hypothetical protein